MPSDRAWSRNEYARDTAEIAADSVAGGDLAAAEHAFNAEPGEFADKLIAAVRAATLSRVEYETEKHVRIPDDPGSMTVAALDALVRPFRTRFLRSQVSKTELLDKLRAVALRQRRHAEWAPYELVDPLPPRPLPSQGRHHSTPEDGARLREYERQCEEYVRQL